MSERVCAIHIGTHKTGSTLLQRFVEWNCDAFERSGVLFPRSAWYGVVPGHHAAAWELLDHGVGTETATLFSELCENELQHALLSSEEFSLLANRPLALHAFVDLIRRAGYSPHAIVYVRAQPQLAESFFAERIKHHDVSLFSDYLDNAFETGAVTTDRRRVALRASEMLAPFKNALGRERIHVRPYPAGPHDLSIVHDFLETMRFALPGFDFDESSIVLHQTTLNESLSFGHLLGTAFVALFPEIGLPDDPDEFIARHMPSLPRELFDRRFSLLERDDYLRFLEIFARDNHRVLAEYGATAPFLTERDVPPVSDPLWATAAVERPILERCLREWLERARAVKR